MTMTRGGFIRLPGGSVVVALSLPRPPHGARSDPYDCGCRVRILVHAVNRQRALTRLRNLGLRSVYLRGNSAPPTPDEITAVLHHPDGLVWREAPDDDTESWHPIRALWRVNQARARTAARTTVPPTELPVPATDLPVRTPDRQGAPTGSGAEAGPVAGRGAGPAAGPGAGPGAGTGAGAGRGTGRGAGPAGPVGPIGPIGPVEERGRAA
ncbi:hypothetical protein [Streptomyces lydicus]|uniref:hypothetical protein n=1 Tax=Streptomyces lydicus TaxID=47763 RepID=UPI0037BAA2FD